MNIKTYNQWGFALSTALTACLIAPQASALTTLTNNIYEAHIAQQSDGINIGQWNAITAPGHPTGVGNDLLFDQTAVWTNFSSLRIYNTGATYSYGGNGGGTNLDTFFTSEGASSFGANGWNTNWSLTTENLNISQDVVIAGTGFANSAVYHTVAITNNNTSGPIDIGWRNLYDWAVNDPGFDDGPNNSITLSDGTVVVAPTTFEFSHTPGPDELARVTVDPGVASYEPLLALGYDPAFIASLPVTTPEEYAYVSWPSSFGTAFDYTVNPAANVTGDSAGLSWFGRTAGTAISIAAGETVRLTQIVFGVPGGGQPPGTIPEPATLALIGFGLAGLGFSRRRRLSVKPQTQA